MTTNTANLHYINRNGQADLSFYLCLKKAQAGKYATQLLKRAVLASICAIERCQDDLVGSHHLAKYVTAEPEPVIQVTRSRNSQGMFTALSR